LQDADIGDLLAAFERHDGLKVHDLMIGFINEARDIYFARDVAEDKIKLQTSLV